MEDNKITILDEEGNAVELYALEETKINGINYILVTDAADDEDGECFIMKDTSKAEDTEAVYSFVEDDDEIETVGKIFAELVAGDTEVQL